jgi:hypothetical protein
MDKMSVFASACAAYISSDPEALRLTSRSATFILDGADRLQGRVKILFFAVLDQLHLVAFRRVNKGNSTAIRRMWSVR